MSNLNEKKKESMKFSESQQKIIDSRNKNLVVSASAGSGKTTVLIGRLIKLVIEDHVSINEILAMTFTEDAARELKIRLKSALRNEDLNDPWIKHQLSFLEDASISTIHSFCLSLVQEFYYQIPISYTRSQSIDTGVGSDKALKKAYQLALSNLKTSQSIDLNLYRETLGQSEEDIQRTVLKTVEIAQSKPNPEEWLLSCKNSNDQIFPWFLQSFKIHLQCMLESLSEIYNLILETDFEKEADAQNWCSILSKKEAFLKKCLLDLEENNYSSFQEVFLEQLNNTGKTPSSLKGSNSNHTIKTLTTSLRTHEKQIAQSLFTLEEYLQRDQEQNDLRNAFIDLCLLTKEHFEQEKDRLQIIDFSDMEQFACRLLENPSIRQEVKNRYKTILVDEYQDTNDLQETIISLISQEDNVFRVGDLKQSIYGFRHAKPRLMEALMQIQNDKNEVMILNENYRSDKNIVSFNNDFYALLMNNNVLPRQFHPSDVAVAAAIDQSNTQPPVRFLYTSYCGDEEVNENKPSLGVKEAAKLHRSNLYDLIAQDIQTKLEQGARLKDIAILTRTNSSHEDIKKVLEAWSIRSFSQIKKGFWINQAVLIVMSMLRILVNPRDDISMMAVLCSPIGRQKHSFVMQAINHRPAGYSIYDHLRDHPMLGFYKDLLEIQSQSSSLPELITKLYGYQNFYMDSTTEVDKTNLDLLLEKATLANGKMTLANFVDHSSVEQSLNKTGEASQFGREEDAVKISSIHASKGLQYNIVYVLGDTQTNDMDSLNPINIDADLGLSFTYLSPNRYLKGDTLAKIALQCKRREEDLQEHMRLCYVATTRARKELIIVDTIKSIEEYEQSFGWNAIYNKASLTHWLLTLHYNYPTKFQLKLDEKTLLKRPEIKKRAYKKRKMPQYTGPHNVVTSLTASSTKKIYKWNPVEGQTSQGRERGTLLHELVASISWPYTKENASKFANSNHYILDETDLSEILSLNECKQYQTWMQGNHEFECPYIVKNDKNIVHGYMDLVAFQENEIDILDFKSDFVISKETLKERYTSQLETYANAMKQIHPDKTIRTWIYSFHLKEMIQIS